MLLLREQTQDFNISVLEEAVNGSPTKQYYLSGIHMQSESVNKNQRIYPRPILENEINRYSDLIKAKRSVGELGHPDTPTVDYKQTSHLIVDLHFEGNDVVGKSKIMDTPNGKIVKTLIDEGVSLGMSSRALGSVENINGVNYVQKDLRLSAVDIVHEPSAPDAFVNGIFEGKEWLLIDGIWTQQHMEKSKRILENLKAADVERVALLIFENYLGKIRL